MFDDNELRAVGPNLRKVLVALVAIVVTSGMFAGTALAANPHFIQSALGASGPDAAGDLTVDFKIAGLDGPVSTTVTASADATAEYACRNEGGNFPEDPKKQEVRGPVTTSGEFTSGKNGHVTGSLTLSPPPATIECPPGQNLVFLSVSYTNVQVSNEDAGTESIPGTFSRTFIEL